jgi:glutathione S-transferase
MTATLTLYGAEASGAVAVEAALTLLGLHYTIVEGATWAEEAARDRVATSNPMRQIPTLVMPDGEVMTESAAILIYLADLDPAAGLAPAPGDPLRRQFLGHLLAALDQARREPHRRAGELSRVRHRSRARAHRLLLGQHGRPTVPG